MIQSRINSLADLVSRVQSLLETGGTRTFLAIAGAPGSGKSTLAEALFDNLDKYYPGKIAILPMDGFHFDDAVLKARNRLRWKGAPDTFDVGGLRSCLERLKAASESCIAVPVFDRTLEISRGSARIIPDDTRLVIVEGNYLLLDESPWNCLAPFFDLTLFVEVNEAELRRRLMARWGGFDMPDSEITSKVEENDLPNGKEVISKSRLVDIIFCAEAAQKVPPSQAILANKASRKQLTASPTDALADQNLTQRRSI